MVDDKAEDMGPSAGPDLRRPKRAPPTIDLPASAVTSETAKAPVEPGSAAADAAAAPAAATTDTEVPTAAETHAEAEPASEPAAEPAAAAPPRRSPSMTAAAGSGAIAAALVVGVAWFAGWQATPTAPQGPQANSMALDALSARIARVESRPAAPAATSSTAAPAADPALAGRLDAMEKSVAALRGDLAAARTQSEGAATAVKELKSAPPAPAAAPVNLAPVNDRLAQLDRAIAALKSDLSAQSARPADDKPLRRVVAASLLDGAVRQGEPFAAQLAAAKPLAEDAGALKPLEAFAASGIPSAAALSRELVAALPKATAATEAPPAVGTGFVDRLQAGAARLVRIQRTDAVAGDDRGAIVARATAAAARNDIASARRELTALAPADRGAVQSWMDKVDARDAALAAARAFATTAMTALNKPAP